MEAYGKTLFWISEENLILEVPFFQRPYVWDEENWQTLISSIKNANGNSMPFIGSVILQEKSDNLNWVIDGQQRLTTLSLLIKALLDFYKTLSPKVRSLFEGIIYNTEVANIDSVINEPRIIPSYSDKEDYLFLMAENISQDELAEKLGYKSFTTVQKWEDGTSFPKVSNLNKLATMFNVELDDLLNVDLTNLKVAVPIMGEVKAGYNMYADENILGYEYLNNSEYKQGEYFYLKVKGDSMINDRICNGDMVYVKKQDYLNKNDIGVFLVENSEVTVKRYDPHKDSITLKGANPRYKNKSFKQDDIKILGKVLHLRVNL